MVYAAQQLGLQARGLEPHEGYSEFAREHLGVEVHTGKLDLLAPTSADVITLFHVLEHLPDPRQAMWQLSQGLKPGGLLVIEVPNILQWDASPSNIYFGAHLYYFNRLTLNSLAEPYFEAISILDDGNLWAVFRRRETVIQSAPPHPRDVAAAIEQFDQKGWWSYLTRGQGWRKPWLRIQQMRDEKTSAGQSPQAILDRLILQAKASRNWPGSGQARLGSQSKSHRAFTPPSSRLV